MAAVPLAFSEALNLQQLGVPETSIRHGLTTMESDKWIICVEPTQVTMIDLANGAQVTRRPIQAEAAIMCPGQNVLALRSGTTVQMFNLDAKQKLKSHVAQEPVVFWKWTSSMNLALVTGTSVWHWSINGQDPPVKIFDRNQFLGPNTQIINYRVSEDGKWCLLGGLSQGSAPGIVNGNMQLYSVEKAVSQPLQGHAAAFAQLKLPGREEAQVIVFHEKKADSQEPPKLYIREVGRDPSRGAPFGLVPAVIAIPPDAATDFPSSFAIDQKDEIAFMLTKIGYVYMFDMQSGKTIYRAKITADTIFLTCPQQASGAVFGITARKGQVFRLQLNGPALVPYILSTLRDSDLALKLAGRLQLPGAENLMAAEFDRLLSQGMVAEAAKIVAASGTALRTPATIARFQQIPPQPGQIPPLLLYFSTLLETGSLNEQESIEVAKLVLQQQRLPLMEKCLTEDKLTCSEQLGDLIMPYDAGMALSVYLRSGSHAKAIQCFVQRGEYDKIVPYASSVGFQMDYSNMLNQLLFNNPQGALDLAKGLVNAEGGPLIDIQATAEAFLSSNRVQETTAFLLEALKDNKPEHAYLQTKLLEINLIGGDKFNPNYMNQSSIATIQITKQNEEAQFLAAAESGDLYTIQQCILNKTVNVDAKNEYGWTALYYAAWYGYLSIVQYLVQQGNATVNIATDAGHTALHFASQNGHLEIVQYLIQQAKANAQACTEKGGTAIHIACQSGHLQIVRYLIEHCGASTNDYTKNGKTPLDVAIENDKKDIIAYLKSKMEPKLQFKTENQYSTLGKNNNNTESIGAKSQGDKMIQNDRNQLLKLVNDPTLEPFSISLEYINECTSNFTSKSLGGGAFGKVYYGSDKVLGLQLAIKKVPLQVMDKETLDQITLSFRREISVLKRFRHPNIVIMYGFNVEVGQSSQVLVYEYLCNGALSDFLSNKNGRTRLSATTRLSIMYQIARSINFLHKGGVDNLLILHRDIKSGNICLTNDYTAKLIDCGLAKFVDRDSHETQKGSISPTMLKSSGSAVFGTPGYICPMYARGNLKYNESCDMYSVGIVMTELIVGCLQSNQSSRGEQSFGDYFNRYIKDDDDEPVENGWKLLMEDADPDVGWSNHNIENLCKLVTQCIIASPKKRMMSSELTDKLWEISKNEFHICYDDFIDVGHKMNATQQVQQVEIDDQPLKPCVLCFKFNNSSQYVSCKRGHILCVQCIEELIQKQIGRSGSGVICSIDHCNGLFDDDALFGKISPTTYNRYIVERGLQLTNEKHFMEIKNLLLKQERLTKQYDEKATVRHCEMMQSLQNMGSMIDATTQRTLHALAYLATENIQQCPTLVWLVPSDRTAGRSAKDWIKWAKSIACQKYDLYFVCQQSYTVVEPKMVISVPRQWLIQAGPVLQLSMLLIKAGLTAVTGAPALPFPIPNLSRNAQIMMSEEFVSSLIDESTERIMNAFNVACTQNSDLPHLESSQLLTLTGVGYELIVEKATKLKRSQWKESMQPVMNQYGKLIWVKKEYVRDVMKTKKLDPVGAAFDFY